LADRMSDRCLRGYENACTVSSQLPLGSPPPGLDSAPARWLRNHSMNRGAVIVALAATAAVSFGPAVRSAEAAPVSAAIEGDVATLNLDGGDNTETVSVEGGLLVHSGVGGSLKSTADWDSAADGEQTVPADGSHIVVVNGGDGNDAISVLASTDDLVFAEL